MGKPENQEKFLPNSYSEEFFLHFPVFPRYVRKTYHLLKQHPKLAKNPNFRLHSAENTGQLGPKTPPFLGPKTCKIQAKNPQNTSKTSKIGEKPPFGPHFEWSNRPKTQVNLVSNASIQW